MTGIEQEIKALTSALQKEINGLKETQKKMTEKIKGFDKKYSVVLDSIQGFKKNMEEQDSLMRELMNFFKQSNVDQQDIENIVHTYNHVSNTGQVQLERLSESTAPVLIPSDNNIQQQSIIPVLHTNTPTRKRKRIQPGWSVPPRVLLVDDDSIFRRLSTKLLQVAGCTIDVAVDGVEAVRKLGSGKYDLVLMVSLCICGIVLYAN
jgi:osomolarity two-component system response regulator SKN7